MRISGSTQGGVRLGVLGGCVAALILLAGFVPPASAAKPDLVVKRLGDPPAQLAVGANARVPVTVANRSRARAPKSTTRLYASFDGSRDETDTAVGKLTMKAGQRLRSERVVVKLPPATPLDALRLVACADDASRVREKSETNNCRTARRPFVANSPPTTIELIQRARDAGEITLDQAMLYKLRAIIGAPKPPERFRAANPTGGIDGVARGVVADIFGNWDALSEATKLEVDAYLRPPNYEGAGLGAPDETLGARRRGVEEPPACFTDLANPRPPDIDSENWDSFETEHFRFWHYTAALDDFNTDPAGSLAAAQNMAAVAEHVYDVETAVFGREPLSDAGHPCNSGDAKIDVYSYRYSFLTAGAQVVPFAPGYAFRPGFMLVTPSFVADPTQARDVFAHEFAHLVQLAYDYADVPSRNADYGWLEEATSNWAIDHVYPEDDFEHPFGRDYVWNHGFKSSINLKRGYPASAAQGYLGTENGYEDYLFLFYLARKYSPALIGQIWANTESKNSIDAIDQAIPGGFAQRWPEFSRYNLNRGDLAHYRAWDGFDAGYKLDGSTQPHMEVGLKGAARKVLPWPYDQQSTLYPLATRYASFDFEDEEVRHVELRDFGFEPSFHEPDEHDRVFAWFRLADGSSEVEDWSEESSVTFCRDKPAEDIQQLVVLYTNAHPDDYIADEGQTQTSFPMLEGDTTKAKARVVAAKRCSWPEKWSGRASGTVTYDGLTESWTATYTTNRFSQDEGGASYGYGLDGEEGDSQGTMVWSIAGTNDAGCEISGSGTVDLVARLDLFALLEPPAYATDVRPGDYVQVTSDCPTSPPQTLPYFPLNCDCAAMRDPFTEPYPSDLAELQGEQSYTAGTGESVTWRWHLVPGPTPPPEGA